MPAKSSYSTPVSGEKEAKREEPKKERREDEVQERSSAAASPVPAAVSEKVGCMHLVFKTNEIESCYLLTLPAHFSCTHAHIQPFTSREVKLIKQQQKLLEKLEKKANKEAERRRKQEAKRRRREEDEQRKREGRKKVKRPKVSNCSEYMELLLGGEASLIVLSSLSLPSPSRVRSSQSGNATLVLPWRWLLVMMGCLHL